MHVENDWKKFYEFVQILSRDTEKENKNKIDVNSTPLLIQYGG